MFDLQVNGYAGVDFNSGDLTSEELLRACSALRRDGIAQILATIITDDIPVMCARLSRIAEICRREPLAAEVVAGIHIEGPFISPLPGFHGCHPRQCAVPAHPETMQLLLEAGQGLVRLVTLAPEADPQCSVVRLLAEKGIAAAAGHTDASLETLQRSVDNGLSLFTHLGNACPQQLHRHDNIFQRALALRRHLRYTFIADGVHVPFFVLRNCFDLIGVERCAVVSDAIAPAGLGPGRFSMGRWNLIIGEDLVARSPDGSHLVGSGQGLHQSRSNLLRHLGMTEDEADLLTSANPRAWASPA